jgi:hypothetical protein
MSQHTVRPELTRRNFLSQSGGGLGSLALAMLLHDQQTELLGADNTNAARPLPTGLHHPAKVRRVIQLFMNGGVSQMDTFDYKPELTKQHGKKVDFGIASAATSAPGTIMKSPFEFRQYGDTGRWVSSVLEKTAAHVDDLAFLMAMQSKSNVHGPASYMQNTGFLVGGYPSMGAWLSYGLGRLTDNLPTFVVLPDYRGLPYNNGGNFSSGFLPAAHSATLIYPSSTTPIANLRPPKEANYITRSSETDGLALLSDMNESHQSERPGDLRLDARIASFELAAQMQLSAPEALDLSRETQQSISAYGIDQPHTEHFGRNCLVARRLVERGVRFVQVWSGMGGPKGNWDNHSDIHSELPAIASSVDQPIAALLTDLKQRGLYDDTLVIWTTEFGRMPFTQGATGRDHNGGTFVTWLAGAGIAAGTSHGSSDDFGYRAAQDGTFCYDLHATILHLLGIDHTRLTFRHNGIDRRLTDVHGHVIHSILS